jgi:hypothetical protein
MAGCAAIIRKKLKPISIVPFVRDVCDTKVPDNRIITSA